jgi:transcriptional regulator with XRE-family HTH domain
MRRARHLSQRQLAGRMQVPRTYISKIENGKAIPTLGSLERLATALGVEMRQLVRDARSRRDEEVDRDPERSVPGRDCRAAAASGLAAPDAVLRRGAGRGDRPAAPRRAGSFASASRRAGAGRLIGGLSLKALVARQWINSAFSIHLLTRSSLS